MTARNNLADFYQQAGRTNRVIASIALGNTDDQLRNHGFLTDRGSWTLSPAFEVNPNPDVTRARSTSVMGADALPDEGEGLLALAEECSLAPAAAREKIGRVAAMLSEWRDAARRNGVAEREITMMSESIEPRLEVVSRAVR